MLHAVLDKERGAVHESDSIHAQPLRLEELRAHVGCAVQTDVFPFRAAMRNALYTASFLSASEHFLQTLRPSAV